MVSTYDRNSGQVFTETTLPLAPTEPAWTSSSRWTMTSKPLKWRKPETGARQLLTLSLMACTHNVRHITSSDLCQVPYHLGKKIYEAIEIYSVVDLRTWKAFIEAYGAENNGIGGADGYNACVVNRDKSIPFTTHLMYTVSYACDWLTQISLNSTSFDLAGYMAIADLPNLVKLKVGKSIPLENRILQAWSKRVRDGEGTVFPSLRVLFLNAWKGSMRKLLRYLEIFPVLEIVVFEAYNPHFDHAYEVVGSWQLTQLDEDIQRKLQGPGLYTVFYDFLGPLLSPRPTPRPVLSLDFGLPGLTRLTDYWRQNHYWLRKHTEKVGARPISGSGNAVQPFKKQKNIPSKKPKSVGAMLQELV